MIKVNKTHIAAILIILGASSAHAASRLECDLLKQNILALNQQINMQQQESLRQRNREAMQQAQLDPWESLAYGAGTASQRLGSAFGGSSQQEKLQNMINVYNQNCQ